MDKINMINYQQFVLQTKFGKRKEKQSSKSIRWISLLLLLLIVFFSLALFLNKDSQGFSSAAALSEPWLSEGDKWVL
tara:strand:- start:273 stop:503 length:231 start_codon:yes stop_codon:yes gene_type:complete